MKVIRKIQDQFEAEQFLGPNHPLPFSGRGDPCEQLGSGSWICRTHSGSSGYYDLSLGDWVVKERDGDDEEFSSFECWPDEMFKAEWVKVNA
jgi:hypothetical protein